MDPSPVIDVDTVHRLNHATAAEIS